MSGEIFGILVTGALVGMVIAGKIELLLLAAPNRE
jgi:CBS-domain-containing membrane protein